MKRIEALVRTSRLDDVVNRLRLIGVTGMTVTQVHSLGETAANPSFSRGQRLQLAAPRYQLMVVVLDEDAAHVVAAILTAARADAGDDLVTVTDVLGVMRIRTNEIDADALG